MVGSVTTNVGWKKHCRLIEESMLSAIVMLRVSFRGRSFELEEPGARSVSVIYVLSARV